MSAGSLVSTSDEPLSCKCPHILSSKDKSTFFSSAEKKLKVLDFKSQKGMLLLEEMQHLAQLHGEGSSSIGKDLGLGP
jgi:hypothetical protein